MNADPVSSITSRPSEGAVGRRLRWAIALSLIGNVALDLGGFALPGQDEVPAGAKVAGVVLAAVAILGAYGLSRCRRWGARTTIAVSALNLLSAIAGLTDPPNAALAFDMAASLPACIGTIVFLAAAGSRGELR